MVDRQYRPGSDEDLPPTVDADVTQDAPLVASDPDRTQDAPLAATAPAHMFASTRTRGQQSTVTQPGGGGQKSSLPRAGQSLGPYVLERELGRGGMGAVFLGRHQSVGTRYAIKVQLMRKGTEAQRELRAKRFAREARALAKVDRHPGIVRVHHYDLTADGLAYCALELVDGGDLGALLKSRGRLELDQALELTEGIADALAHVHEAGIVHRDLKPANVLINSADGRPMLTDFGLALDSEEERLTQSHMVLGTPHFLAPEQLGRSDLQSKPHTDVYALGVVLYLMLTGETPFPRAAMSELMAAILRVQPKPPSELCEGLPADVDRLVLKMLAKAPEERPTTDEVIAALGALRRGEVMVLRGSGFGRRLRRKLRRTWPVWVLLLGLVGAVVVGGYIAPAPDLSHEHRLEQALTEDISPVLEQEGPLLAPGSDSEALVRRMAVEAYEILLRSGFGRRTGSKRTVVDDVALLRRAYRHCEADTNDPLGAHLWAVEQRHPGTRARLGRLLARVGAVHGVGRMSVTPEDDPETLFFDGLVYVGWRHEFKVDLDLGRALLTRAKEGDDPQVQEAATRVLRVMDLIDARIAAQESDPTFEIDRDLLEPIKAELAKELPGLESSLDTYIAARRVEERRAGVDLIARAVVDRLNGRPKSVWKERAEYDRVTGLLINKLIPHWQDYPEATIRVGCTRILRAVVARALEARAKGPALDALVNLMDALTDHVDWSDEGLRKPAHDLLVFGMNRALGRRELPSLKLVLVLPRLGRLPVSRTQRSIWSRYLNEGHLARHLEKPENRTGDAYLLWARGIEVSSRGNSAAHYRKLAQLYAQALGNELDLKELKTLGLDPALMQPLMRPLTRRWRVFALTQLYRCTWKIAWKTDPTPWPSVLMATRKLAELAEKPTPNATPSHRIALLLEASSSQANVAHGRGQTLDSEQARQCLTFAQEARRLSFLLYRDVVTQKENASTSLGATAELDRDHCLELLERSLACEAEGLRQSRRGKDVTARYEGVIDKVRDLKQPEPLGLLNGLCEEGWKSGKERSAISRAARRILKEVERSPGAAGKIQRARLKYLLSAHYQLARIAAEQGEQATARVHYRAARAKGGGTSDNWFRHVLEPLGLKPE